MVSKTEVPRRCAVYSCGNTAEFSFGEGSPSTHVYLCADHLRQVVAEGGELLSNYVAEPVWVPMDMVDNTVYIPANETTVTTTNENENINGENAEIPQNTELKHENKLYACKKCGMSFSDINEYRRHCMHDHREVSVKQAMGE